MQRYRYLTKTILSVELQLMLLQPRRWCCVDCVIHHQWDVREEQEYICVARASNSKRDCDAWSLPRCGALRTCRSGFLIATIRIVLNKCHARQPRTVYFGSDGFKF